MVVFATVEAYFSITKIISNKKLLHGDFYAAAFVAGLFTLRF